MRRGRKGRGGACLPRHNCTTSYLLPTMAEEKSTLESLKGKGRFALLEHISKEVGWSQQGERSSKRSSREEAPSTAHVVNRELAGWGPHCRSTAAAAWISNLPSWEVLIPPASLPHMVAVSFAKEPPIGGSSQPHPPLSPPLPPPPALPCPP